MDKIIQFKKMNQEKIIKKYELEDCDQSLIDLAEKLIQCNPGRDNLKKKEALKTEFMKKAEEYRNKPQQMQELSDDDLDSAAGGLAIHYEDSTEDPFNDR